MITLLSIFPLRFFEDGQNDDLQLKFYEYMIEFGLHEQNYLEICKNYRAVYDTKVTRTFNINL